MDQSLDIHEGIAGAQDGVQTELPGRAYSMAYHGAVRCGLIEREAHGDILGELVDGGGHVILHGNGGRDSADQLRLGRIVLGGCFVQFLLVLVRVKVDPGEIGGDLFQVGRGLAVETGGASRGGVPHEKFEVYQELGVDWHVVPCSRLKAVAVQDWGETVLQDADWHGMSADRARVLLRAGQG